jgi:voltage-gated potassium channel
VRIKSHIERRMDRFLHEPPSVRLAARIIVVATAIVVAGGGILMRAIDHKEYANVWVGMWWAIQTVTTVGYGDVTPKEVSGRIVAVLVMLWGIAFLTIIIAAITSTFVARATGERVTRKSGSGERTDGINARLDGVEERLERLEVLLRERANI